MTSRVVCGKCLLWASQLAEEVGGWGGASVAKWADQAIVIPPEPTLPHQYSASICLCEEQKEHSYVVVLQGWAGGQEEGRESANANAATAVVAQSPPITTSTSCRHIYSLYAHAQPCNTSCM